MQYAYYGSAMQMAADLKAIAKRVRARAPKMFITHEIEEKRTDQNGMTAVVRTKSPPLAVAMTPNERHRFAKEKR